MKSLPRLNYYSITDIHNFCKEAYLNVTKGLLFSIVQHNSELVRTTSR